MKFCPQTSDFISEKKNLSQYSTSWKYLLNKKESANVSIKEQQEVPPDINAENKLRN